MVVSYFYFAENLYTVFFLFESNLLFFLTAFFIETLQTPSKILFLVHLSPGDCSCSSFKQEEMGKPEYPKGVRLE